MKEITIDINFIKNSVEAAKQQDILLVNQSHMRLVSLLTEFDLNELTDEIYRLYAIAFSETDKNLLKSKCLFIRTRNTYSLDDYERNCLLRSFRSRTEMEELLDQIAIRAHDVTQLTFNQVIKGTAPPLEEQNLDQLVATFNISKWFEGTVIELPDAGTIMNHIRREEILLPFKKLTANFKGRQADLNKLTDYVDWLPKSSMLEAGLHFLRTAINWTIKPPLFVTGIGGVGKSTLIAKFILEHVGSGAQKKIPFIYYDFDKPGLSISNIISLGKEGLRQLMAQFPEHSSMWQLIIDNLELQYTRNFDLNTSRASDRFAFYKQIVNENSAYLQVIDSPILVVFDSFEELQYRTSAAELTTLFDFLHEISAFVPRLRIVFAGRSQVNYKEMTFDPIHLESFDEASSSGYLENLGIKDESIRRSLFKKFGGNPLTLQLSAELILNEDKPPQQSVESIKTRKLFSRIDEKLVQQQLVKRNLDHIHDDRVRAIAIPGILVRKISPEIIRNVLAVPCGLGEIEIEDANVLYNELIKESFLLSFRSSHISFRQDLRIALYDLILKDPKYKAKEVHDQAVKFYSGKESPEDRAELLYHCLKRGDDPSVIDSLYSPDMRAFLDNSMIEFPDRAYIHLSRVMGLTVSEDRIRKSDLSDWEEYQVTEIKNILASGDEGHLRAMRRVLSGRQERSAASPLFFYEAKLHERLGNYKLSNELIDTAIVAISDEDALLNLYLLKSKLLEYQFDFTNALDILMSAYEEIPFLQASNEMKVSEPVVDFYFSALRLLTRENLEAGTDGKFEKIRKQLLGKIAQIYSLLNQGKSKDLDASHFLPRPYKAIYQAYKNELNISLYYFADTVITFSGKQAFNTRYEELKAKIKPDKVDLDAYLKENYGLLLKDITEPGVYSANLFDVLLFMEVFKSQRCFVVMGFGTKTDLATGRRLNLDKTYELLIRPVVLAKGFLCLRADEIPHSGSVDVPVYQQLLTADLVIADLSTSNPNAFYELGLRHGLRPRMTIIVSEDQHRYPFDLNHIPITTYSHLGETIDPDEVFRFRKILGNAIDRALSNEDPDSPVYTFLDELVPPSLTQKAYDMTKRFGTVLTNTYDNNYVYRTSGDDYGTKTLSIILTQAEELMKEREFGLAQKLFRSALLLVDTETALFVDRSHVVHRLALATYKAKLPDEVSALEEAMQLLKGLDLSGTNNPETLELAATVEKNLYFAQHEQQHLDNAIQFYERAYFARPNRYTGINLAFVISSRITSGLSNTDQDKMTDYVVSNRFRKQVLEMCNKEWEEFAGRRDVLKNMANIGAKLAAEEKAIEDQGQFWILANKAEAHLGLGQMKEYDEAILLAEATPHESWMMDSLNDQLGKLKAILDQYHGHRNRHV